MWDEDIRRKYWVAGSAAGYLEFLNKVKEKLQKAIEEEAGKRGCSNGEIVDEICKELPSKKLGANYTEKP